MIKFSFNQKHHESEIIILTGKHQPGIFSICGHKYKHKALLFIPAHGHGHGHQHQHGHQHEHGYEKHCQSQTYQQEKVVHVSMLVFVSVVMTKHVKVLIVNYNGLDVWHKNEKTWNQ